MRARGIVVLVTVVVAACAQGASGVDESGLPASPGPSGSGSTPSGGPGLKVPDSGGGGGGDASGSSSGGGDASSSPDAPSPPDAGGDAMALVDAGPPVAGQCAKPVDISAGGTFTLDTCAIKASFTSTCVTSGSGFGAALRGDAPSGGSSYFLTVPSGWVVQQADASCGPMPFSCAAGSWGVSGFMGVPTWTFVVARADGTCGSVTVTVTRS